jgi:hypothetical protein
MVDVRQKRNITSAVQIPTKEPHAITEAHYALQHSWVPKEKRKKTL